MIRVDGGKIWGVSMGHIKRSLSLAEELKNKYDIIFLMQNYIDGVNYVRQFGWDVHTIPIGDNSDRTIIDFCRYHNPIKIIFDLNQFKYPTFTQYAKTKGLPVIVFDIIGFVEGEPTIIFNDSMASEHMNYNHLQCETRLCIGSKYFILPFEYGRTRKRDINPIVNNIVITMGGSDPAGLTIKILNSIIKFSFNVHYHIILGPLFDDTESVIKLSEEYSNITMYTNPRNFVEILSDADIVITAGGRTLFESSYLGIPAIILPSIEHENVTAIEYAKRTGAINLGLWNDEWTPIKMGSTMNKYMSNYKYRQSLSETSRQLIDGIGIYRIIDIINSL
ncbi:UDP-2,4-diacetamido-2,4,6-trideoxy-beta-L-altropyranose hydrolase [Methanocalculus sp. MC3]